MPRSATLDRVGSTGTACTFQCKAYQEKTLLKRGIFVVGAMSVLFN